ncbi:MAG: hypothetical protein HY225_00425 [Candidatus Vogelbacteria bacterium]|nr:hypothetical protein [Candidatus Vogelbacteria bacterium]
MDNIIIFLAVFVVAFFTISSVSNQSKIQSYNKTSEFNSIGQLVAETNDQSATVLSSLYRIGDVIKMDVTKSIKIKSINETDNDKITNTGVVPRKIDIYLVFSDPKLKKDGNMWRIYVTADVKTVDSTGKRTKFLNGSSIQEINNKYSYELDSGAFVFNLNTANDIPHGQYMSTFTIHDLFSGRKDQKTVSFKI